MAHYAKAVTMQSCLRIVSMTSKYSNINEMCLQQLGNRIWHRGVVLSHCMIHAFNKGAIFVQTSNAISQINSVQNSLRSICISSSE